jgi:hypothetical protein
VDNNTIKTDMKKPRYDVLTKTRWLLEFFSLRSKELYNPEPMITVDELVVPYTGPHLFQFMKDKPHRFGLKIWYMYSSHSRFVLSIEVYEGVGTGLGEHGLGYHVTLWLLAGYEGVGYTMVVDNNFFAFVCLFHDLMVLGF